MRGLSAAVRMQRRAAHRLTDLPRGSGGRSSFSGITATVFGTSGFYGRYVVNQLAKCGTQVIIPYRGDPYWNEHLRTAADLGQMYFQPFHLLDDESMAKAVRYSHVVVNLMGKDWTTRNFTMDDIHNVGARRLARICREEGVQRFIHVSALNASENPQEIGIVKGGSEFYKSKARGELAVREEFPSAVIVRPSDTWGEEDRFLKMYSSSERLSFGLTSKKLPLWRHGLETEKQPVDVQDVAKGIRALVLDPETDGKTYEFVGPGRYVLKDMVYFLFQNMRYFSGVPEPVLPAIAFQNWVSRVALRTKVMRAPFVHLERIEREYVTDVVEGLPNLEDLGVQLTPLENKAEWHLMPYRRFNDYHASPGEFPKAEPLPRVTPTRSNISGLKSPLTS